MRTSTIIVLALAAVFELGCEQDQWLISLHSDAPVPQFGDRLLIEVLDEQGALACADCRHQIAAPQEAGWPVSLGIQRPDEGGERLHLRARLFRSAIADESGSPQSTALIDYLGRLPDDGETITNVTLNLAMSCFGVASDPVRRETCNPTTGRNGPEEALPSSKSTPRLRIGSWAPAREEPCVGPTPEGMVCIPGGIFLLGNPNLAFYSAAEDDAEGPERLVKLSPFFLDLDEFSTDQARRLVDQGQIEALYIDGKKHSDRNCFYVGSGEASTSASKPLNCIFRREAAALCASLGKRLPTEAEWEFAAGNRTRDSEWPWGDDGDPCRLAIVGIGRLWTDYGEDSSCNGISPNGGWPEATKPGGDVTLLGVRSLAGSLQEWVGDELEPYKASFWTPSDNFNYLENPFCRASKSRPGSQMVRGGSWCSPPFFSRASARHAMSFDNDAWSPSVGFRCAKPASPSDPE